MKHNEDYHNRPDILMIGFNCAIIAITFLLLLTDCKSPKESQESKNYKASVAHEKLLEEVRAKYPCDTSTVVITKMDTTYLDNTEYTVYTDTGKVVYKNRIITNTITKQITVVDSAYGAMWQDRYNQAGYLLQVSKEQSDKIAAENTKKDEQIRSLKPWKARAVFTWVMAVISMAGFLYLKFKP